MSHSKTYLLILILLICTTNVCMCDEKYYSQLKTIVSSNSPTGSGLVYAGSETVKPSDTTYVDKESSYRQGDANSSGKDQEFYAYARANKGYIFNGWTKTDYSTDYLSTDSIYIVKIKCSTKSNGTNTETYYAVFGYDSITITYTAPTNGTYTATYSDITITMSPDSETQQKTAAETITLTATPNTDYKFVCFTKEVGNVKSILSIKTPYTFAPTEDATVYAEFIPDTLDWAVFSVDGELYFDLNKANAAALSSTSRTIILLQSGTLPAGNYTISSGITLLVPYNDNNTWNTIPNQVDMRVNISRYRTLTMQSGSNVIVNGVLCVASEQFGTTSGTPGPGAVSGSYGCIDMSQGGHITINSGANLYVQGFIVGKDNQSESGTITIKDGGTVYENIVINDMHGGGGTSATVNGTTAKNNYGLFPFNQYYIQNIEPKMTIEYGGTEKVVYDVYSSSFGGKHDVTSLIGNSTNNLFTMTEGSMVTKWYDMSRDYQCYAISGDFYLNELSIYASSSLGLISSNFILPITNNIDITILNGSIGRLDKPIKLLPGVKLKVEQGGKIELNSDLYVYDCNEWDKFAIDYIRPMTKVSSPGIAVSRKNTKTGMGNASLIVDGTISVGANGAIYTTTTGASIVSESAGKIIYTSAVALTSNPLYEIWSTYGKSSAGASLDNTGKDSNNNGPADDQVLVGSYSFLKSYYTYGTPVATTPAQLKNADASYLSTAGVSANTTINYRNGHWGWLTKWLDYDGTTQLHQEIGINQKESTDYTYTGTIPSDKEFVWETATDEDNQEVTYTAKWLDPEGPALDIVSWTADSLTINATGFTLSGWPYTINGVSYGRENATTSTKCKADRTVTIPYTGKPDGQFQIQVKNKSGNTYSFHAYTIPHIYTNDATLSDTKSTSTVFVNAGNLTINTATTLAAIYVSPSAQLTVSAPLTVGNLYLRTTAWNAAVLQNNSTITADHAYYTRIVADKTRYFQFAIPLSSNTKEVTLSNGLSCPYGKAWLLKSYSESSRAEQGITNTETASNWVLLDSTIGTINGTTGYELYSNSAYYREFYFPVTLPASPATQVPVSCTNGAAGALHAGWNALCSPLLGSYKQTFSDPSEAIKVSKLMTWGLYQQYIPETILPAVPFYYQAPKSGNLDFSGTELTQKAPLREWQVKVATQWIRLVLSDAEGLMLDETNIFIHPDKFTVDYESGYDVTKLSLQGEKALLYSELPCGALAFAAVPDSLAKTLIPITVYADEDETCTFHLSDNAYRTRLSNVFLRDTETDALIDLTTGDYQTAINKGTTRGRFYITCVFSDFQDINDRLDNPLYNNSDEEVRKILYNDHIYILRNGSIYDITGRRCEIK